ncbi:MAG: hypothetical protein HY813_02440 [Candidatus Portnoybacteria bacterium]|nr:hypothetical protein [Candidatus Portnoybacteria bacterium]
MIFGWFWNKKEKKYDWSRFVGEDECPEEFLADLIVGVLTLASLEYNLTEFNYTNLEQAFCRLGQEFRLPGAKVINDDCGYPQPPASVISALFLSNSRGVRRIRAHTWGVPNQAVQENMQYLQKRGRGFFKALYPVVDRFVELATKR